MKTKQYSVHLPVILRRKTQKLADADTVARGNWSVWLENLLRSIVEQGQVIDA